MKISTKWLAQYVNLPETPVELAQRESVTGIEVDEIIQPAAGLKKLVVGQITKLTAHPNSDHLNICQVDVGTDEPLHIICGAPNVAAGQKVIVALPGARIANNQKIKRSKMRGEESQGMICSLQEIGFDETVVPEEFKNGIYVFPDEVTVSLGDDVYGYLGMDDTILDFDITPNRADTLGMRGTAWEVAAMYDEQPHFQHPQLSEAFQPAQDVLKVNVADSQLIPIYRTRVVKNVQVKPSPLWLQIHLWNNGIRPINNIVDITNYIMLDYGQPLHAFDYDKLAGSQINVRLAKPQEAFQGLNGQDYELTDQDIVIADEQQAVALGGIMGGNFTKISDTTHTVVLEAAYFDPVHVRKTAQRHNLRTEASIRHEKGLDLSATPEALDMAAQLLTQLGEGTVLKDQIIGAQCPLELPKINITTARINHVLGTQITQAEVIAIFKRLGFKVTSQGEQLVVEVPLRRWDISLDADLIEEVVRIYGFDKLPSTLPVEAQTPGHWEPQQQFYKAAQATMRALGYDEAISYALLNQTQAQAFTDAETTAVQLAWPMTQDHEFLRQNLVSGLLNDLVYNIARKQTDLALFEQGRVFQKVHAQDARPQEIEMIAGVKTGQVAQSNWQQASRMVDFYDLKGDVEALLSSFNKQADISFVATDQLAQLHPGQSAWIQVDQQIVGFLGKLHPHYAHQLNLPATFVFQLNLEKIWQLPKRSQIDHPAPKYPAVTRDIAIEVAKHVTNAAVEQVIQTNAGPYLTQIQLFDVYAGENIAAGEKSLAYRLTFQDPQATLTDTVVNQHLAAIQTALTAQLAAKIR